MKRLSAAVLALAAAACAPQQQEVLYRDAYGSRGQVAMEQDAAQCRYDMARMQAGAHPTPVYTGQGPALDHLASAAVTGPGPAVYFACMESKGWKRVR
ncbi:MAG: hypothetical protein AB7G39_09630 [Alphaproteobacteria bacterium]